MIGGLDGDAIEVENRVCLERPFEEEARRLLLGWIGIRLLVQIGFHLLSFRIVRSC